MVLSLPNCRDQLSWEKDNNNNLDALESIFQLKKTPTNKTQKKGVDGTDIF